MYLILTFHEPGLYAWGLEARFRDLNSLIFQVRRPEAVRDSLGQVVPCTAMRDKQTQAGLSLDWKRTLSSLPAFFAATCVILFTCQGAVPLFAFLGFCKQRVASYAFCAQ